VHEEAGSSTDLREAHRVRQVTDRTMDGERLLAKSRALMRARPTSAGRRKAEVLARQALERLARALDWAEGGADEEEAHQRLDEAGREVRSAFGCTLTRDGDGYVQDCPVALAHNRTGFSIGGVVGKRTCSLCGQDATECEHDKTIAYMVPGGQDDLGWCRVCLAENDCEHLPGELYRTSVVHFLSDLELEEVSLVSTPAHPEARPILIHVTRQQVEAQLGHQIPPNARVSCDRCLASCAGLTKHDWPHG
jgi:hypothetical protein